MYFVADNFSFFNSLNHKYFFEVTNWVFSIKTSNPRQKLNWQISVYV